MTREEIERDTDEWGIIDWSKVSITKIPLGTIQEIENIEPSAEDKKRLKTVNNQIKKISR